jgi:hypothetical protein
MQSRTSAGAVLAAGRNAAPAGQAVAPIIPEREKIKAGISRLFKR